MSSCRSRSGKDVLDDHNLPGFFPEHLLESWNDSNHGFRHSIVSRRQSVLLTASPAVAVTSAAKAAGEIVSFRNRTDPSHIATFTPPV